MPEQVAAARDGVVLAMAVIDQIVKLQKFLAGILPQKRSQIRRVRAVECRAAGMSILVPDILASQGILHINVHFEWHPAKRKRTGSFHIEPEIPRCRRGAGVGAKIDGTAQQPAEC